MVINERCDTRTDMSAIFVEGQNYNAFSFLSHHGKHDRVSVQGATINSHGTLLYEKGHIYIKHHTTMSFMEFRIQFEKSMQTKSAKIK